MNKRKLSVLSLVFLLGNYSVIFSQEDDYPNSPFPDEVTTLNFQHTSFTKQKVGESLIYNFPGFMSDLGSLTYNYKNSNNDSYYGSLGVFYFLVGANKSIVKIDSGIIYLNGSLGLVAGDGLLLGNFGISFFNEINSSSRFELSTSLFLHHGSSGLDGVYAPSSYYYTRGIVGSAIYSKDIFDNLTISFSAGLAFYQLRAMQDSSNILSQSYKYVTWREEKENSELINPRWFGHTIFTWGFTISYNF